MLVRHIAILGPFSGRMPGKPRRFFVFSRWWVIFHGSQYFLSEKVPILIRIFYANGSRYWMGFVLDVTRGRIVGAFIRIGTYLK